jgi:RecB family exonuclease
LPSLEDRMQERLLLARFAFGAATDLAILSFAERERVGGETRNPSGLLLDVASARAGEPLDPRGATIRKNAPPRAPESARRRPADLTDLDLSRLADGAAPTPEDLALFLGQPRARHLGRVLRAAEARWSDPHPGPWDGVLSDPRAIRAVGVSVERRHWSPSRLEKLVNCPFSFLLGLLNVDPSGDETDDFDPLERGQIFHALAERTYRTLLERGLLPLRPPALPEALALVDADIRTADAALAGEPVLARMHRRATLHELRHDLALVLSREAHRPEDERTAPLRFELAFGDEEDANPPTFPLASGGTLPLRGRVDRIDQRADGALEIVDFKTGQTRGAKSGGLRAKADDKVEVRLQLPLYLTAVPQVLGRPAARATYYYATAAQNFDEVTYEAADLDRDRAEIGALLEMAVRRAKEGWFPCTPAASACCFARTAGACGPGVAERFRRKLEDEDLAKYVALVRGQAAGQAEEAS